MMAIMLDLHFKSLCVVENLLGCGNAIRPAIEYDAKIVIPLLMVCFEQLNPTTVNAFATIVTIEAMGEEFEKNMFGVWASIEESSCALVTRELSMFKRFPVFPSSCVDPLT